MNLKVVYPRHRWKTNSYDFESVCWYAWNTKKYKIVDKLIETCKPGNFFKGKPDVLHNLVTKEYITKEDIKKHTGKRRFDICTILLSRICWSGHPWISPHTNLCGEIIKEKWAGKRFDITTADKVDDILKNASEEAAKFLRQICDDKDKCLWGVLDNLCKTYRLFYLTIIPYL